MAEEIIFKTSVETGNSVKAVNDLEKAVSGVGDSVDDTQAQFTQLRNEIKKQSSEVDALSKKYGENSKEADEARKSLSSLNLEYGKLSKSSVDLGAKFEDLHGELQPLSSRLGEIEDRMYELALAGQANTDEFKTLQAEVVKYRQTIISVDKAVDQLAEQGKGLATALQIGTAVTAGYGALQGGMALLGGESEELQKTFVKLQAVQTVLASLEQLKLSLDKQSIVVTKAKAIGTGVMTVAQQAYTWATTGTTVAMKALKVAMLAVPIFAIIAGVMALVSAIQYFTKETETAVEINDKLTASIDKAQERFDRASKKKLQGMDNEIALAKAQGADSKTLHDMEMARLAEAEAHRRIQTNLYKGEIVERKKAYQKALKEGDSEGAKAIADEIKATRKKYLDLKSLDGQYYADKKIKTAEFKATETADEIAKNKENADKWKQAQEKRKAEEERIAKEKIERERLLSDLIINNIDDENLRARAKMDMAHKREREDLIAKYGQDTALIKELEDKQSSEVAEYNKQLQAVRDAEQLEIDEASKQTRLAKAEAERRDERAGLELKLLQMRGDFEAEQEVQRELDILKRDEELANLELTENEKELIREKYRIIEEEREADLKEKKIAMAKEVADQSFGIANQLMGSLQSISDSIYETQLNGVEKGSQAELRIKKKQFESNKKMQIANAIISGVQGALTAFTGAMQLGPIAGPIVGGVLAGVVGVTTALNVNKIKSTKFDSGGGGAVGSQPTVSMPSIPSASDVIGGQNAGTDTAGLTGSGTEAQPVTTPAPMVVKAVLVDSELKAGLDSLENSQNTSSFG